MQPRMRRALVFATAIAAVVVAACGSGSNGGGSGDSATPLPSGSLGVVEPAAARAAVEGLCTIADRDTGDLAAATGVFFDQVHEELHVIAAAVQPRDVDSAAALLEAKEKIESDLQGTQLPESFHSDLVQLIGATRQALQALGLSAPSCG